MLNKYIYIDNYNNELEAEIDFFHKNILINKNIRLKIILYENEKLIAVSNNKIYYFIIKGECLIFSNNKFIPIIKNKWSFDHKIYSLKYIPEFSIFYKNKLFLLNHRCGSSTIRSAILFLEGKITYQDYINSNTQKTNGWGLIWNTLSQTKKIIQTNNDIEIVMFFRDPVDYCISCFNIDNRNNNIDLFLQKIKIQQQQNCKEYINCHQCLQSNILDVLNLDFNNIQMIHINNIDKYFKNKFNINLIKKNISTTKKIIKNSLLQNQINLIQTIYKKDYQFKQNIII